MSILLGADFVPTATNRELFINGNIEELLGDRLIDILSNAEYRIFNLEAPFTDMESPISKTGPSLKAPCDTIAAYKAIHVNALALANNHILDQDEQGIESTINLLSSNGIACFGAGLDVNKAAEPLVITCGAPPKSIGIYACVEHTFAVAGDQTAGANPFDPLNTPDCIYQLKQKVDYVIVLYHSGKSHYQYPSPDQQKICRKLVEKGADLVVCQHSHCIGCFEEIVSDKTKNGKGTIIYGQGDFLFDHKSNVFSNEGLLIQIDNDFQLEYIPLIRSNGTITVADSAQYRSIINGFYERSEQIKSADFVLAKYNELAAKEVNNYLLQLSDDFYIFIFKLIRKLFGARLSRRLSIRISKRCFKEKKLISLRNFIESEAHNELLLAGIKLRLSHALPIHSGKAESHRKK